jgi:hypothetical protein
MRSTRAVHYVYLITKGRLSLTVRILTGTLGARSGLAHASRGSAMRSAVEVTYVYVLSTLCKRRVAHFY